MNLTSLLTCSGSYLLIVHGETTLSLSDKALNQKYYIFNISYVHVKLLFGNSEIVEIVMNAALKDNFAGLENK